jgi:hypothetical protein
MEYTIYDSSGCWLGHVNCTYESDVPLLADNQQVIEGSHGKDTMLIGGVVSPVSGDALVEYNDRLMDELRSQRDLLLKSSDWTQVSDAPVDQAAWATYRQQLRDLPNNTEDPANPTWPTKPE